ncbi:MAG: hypothetical protein KDD83_12875, partial [Caldilineaceae bacterium]|nr:hypothetical protein [Caldilineaceae bacterium]
MNRKYILLISILLVSALMLTACPASSPAPAESGGEAAAPAEEAPAASTEGATVTAMLWSTPRPGDESAIAYCSEQTGINIEVVTGPESATDRLALYLQFLGAGSGDIDLMQIDVIWPGILAEHLV